MGTTHPLVIAVPPRYHTNFLSHADWEINLTHSFSSAGLRMAQLGHDYSIVCTGNTPCFRLKADSWQAEEDDEEEEGLTQSDSMNV